MNDNPYDVPAAEEVASTLAEEPVVKISTFPKKFFATLFLGMILAAVNLLGGTFLGIACTFSIGYLPGVFPD